MGGKTKPGKILFVYLHMIFFIYFGFYRDERKLRLNCSRLALLTILKSWPGLLHFCSPRDHAGFKAIVDVLYLKQREVSVSITFL